MGSNRGNWPGRQRRRWVVGRSYRRSIRQVGRPVFHAAAVNVSGRHVGRPCDPSGGRSVGRVSERSKVAGNARVASRPSERIVKPPARRAARRALLHPARHPRANRRPATCSSDLLLARRAAALGLERLAFKPEAHPVRRNAGRSVQPVEGPGGTLAVPTSQRRAPDPSDRTLSVPSPGSPTGPPEARESPTRAAPPAGSA